jgi:hypothetical protein
MSQAIRVPKRWFRPRGNLQKSGSGMQQCKARNNARNKAGTNPA